MQTSVLRLAEGVLNDQLPDKAQVSQLNDFSCWHGRLPHHFNIGLQQIDPSFGSFESLILANDAHIHGHGPHQTCPVVDDRPVLSQCIQPFRAPCGMVSFVGIWRVENEVLSHTLGENNRLKKAV